MAFASYLHMSVQEEIATSVYGSTTFCLRNSNSTLTLCRWRASGCASTHNSVSSSSSGPSTISTCGLSLTGQAAEPPHPFHSRPLPLQTVRYWHDSAASAWGNAHAATQKHLLHGGFSIADAYLFVTTGWSGFVGIDLERWPSIALPRTGYNPSSG